MTGGKTPHRTLGERLLAPIAEVRQSEVQGVVLQALIMLLLMGAYYMLKTARESLILAHGGAEVKTYSSAAQALILLVLIPAYGALATRVDRARLLGFVTLFFVADLVLFALFGRSIPHIAVVYFLWVGLFNVVVIAQFWAFASDVYTPDQGKRLFPVIGLGSTLGAWIGATRASSIIAVVGPYRVMIGAAAVLGVCVALAVIVHRGRKRRAPPQKRHEADQPLGKAGAFELIRKDSYLLSIAMLMIVVNIATTSSDYLVGRLLVEEADLRFGSDTEARERFIGATYGRLYSYINLGGFLMQLLLVSRVFRHIGVLNALFIHPIIALAGSLLMVGRPSIQVMGWFRVADASTDYSLDNTARQALWLPTSREAKYKAKQAIDSFFVRVGDMLQAGIVYAGNALAFGIQAFAALNAVMVVAWLVIVFRLRRLQSTSAEATVGARRPGVIA
jgi:AAA family ATP:ADP antiporter